MVGFRICHRAHSHSVSQTQLQEINSLQLRILLCYSWINIFKWTFNFLLKECSDLEKEFVNSNSVKVLGLCGLLAKTAHMMTELADTESMEYTHSFLFKLKRRMISLESFSEIQTSNLQLLILTLTEHLLLAISLLEVSLMSTSSFMELPSQSFNPISNSLEHPNSHPIGHLEWQQASFAWVNQSMVENVLSNFTAAGLPFGHNLP